MKLVSIDKVNPGERLTKDVYDQSGRILVKAGILLSEENLERLKTRGIINVFIDNNIKLSSGININYVPAINDETRVDLTNLTRQLFMENETRRLKEKIKKLDFLLDEVINQILSKEGFLSVVDFRTHGEFLFCHSVNVAVISLIIGISMNLNRDQLKKLGIGAIFHDYGKKFVDPTIVNKKEDLTLDESSLMKKHTVLGYNFFKRELGLIPLSSTLVLLQHHEQWNGLGYPLNRNNKEISLLSNIVSVANTYDKFQNQSFIDEAYHYITKNSGILFSPEVVSAFKKKISPYPIGSIVHLDNGLTGIVFEINKKDTLKPKIKIINKNDQSSKSLDLDLSEYEQIGIRYIELMP
jgi:HD-GYP domain-containing protein (c-di-GMP phosphodiesterase class II)